MTSASIYFSGARYPIVRLSIPDDIDRLVANDPDLALKWRLERREALENALCDGCIVSSFVRSHHPDAA